jgi:hypothetical protein
MSVAASASAARCPQLAAEVGALSVAGEEGQLAEVLACFRYQDGGRNVVVAFVEALYLLPQVGDAYQVDGSRVGQNVAQPV